MHPSFDHAQTIVVGNPEVLSVPLPGSGLPVQVNARLIGSRINTRELAPLMATAPQPDSTGRAFVFRYGVVVMTGTTDEQEKTFYGLLEGMVTDPIDSAAEIESATIVLRPGTGDQIDPDGAIVLKELTPERLLLVATVLARSVVLSRDEARLNHVFDTIEPLIVGLQRQGRAILPIRQVMKEIGNVLAAYHRMIGRAQIDEKPDILWEHPELDPLYARLEAEFELSERARTVERKLDVLGDTASTLLRIVQDRRSLRLELAVIILIAMEVVLALQERLLS